MSKLFISHSSKDDAFVRQLQQALGDQQEPVWIDSRQLKGGDPLWPEIQKAIEAASAYVVVVSPDSLQSSWVGRELRHALKLQQDRGQREFPVIPLSLNETKLGVLESYFDETPLYIPVSSQAGGAEAAVHSILVALWKRLPADVSESPQPTPEPLEELVLELTDLGISDHEGIRRATATARLVYEPAPANQEKVVSVRSWKFKAPLGPIEAQELQWYLEKYSIWPSEHFRPRAIKVEANLKIWGQRLHEAALPTNHTANVMQAWARIDSRAQRRFSVHVDSTEVDGASEVERASARQAATLLLGLPWELLHDDTGFLFQGAAPTRVRRRLPNTQSRDIPVVATPIRVLLVTARPEDDACSYIDHRVSALPLVGAMEVLGGLVDLHVLSPPTLPALRGELDRARQARQAYHVVHFDGHGVYNSQVGLGGLCFEEPEDIEKLERRRSQIIYTDKLGPMLRDYRIPLVFLEACQTAQSEKASESVASELLKVGVASVVAMSHSVLVETSRRFVEAFYQALTCGARIGEAMLQGQRELKDNTARGQIFGVGEFRLEDWFVPVLFQEKNDPQLFRATTSPQTRADLANALKTRLGEVPEPPPTTFIGRSHELLALQRLLRNEQKNTNNGISQQGSRYAVLLGQGGEGKTALAAEFARWMVRSQQMRRAAFVSVETHTHVQAVLDALGRQLVPKYTAASFKNTKEAILPIQQVLTEQPTLLVLDNMESILSPPHGEASEALSEDTRIELDAILDVCRQLNAIGETRIVFTSRETLPAPFGGERNHRRLERLSAEDAIRLVERALNADGKREADVAPTHSTVEEIKELVDTVNGHARTLSLLAPALRERGVVATRTSLVELMAEMEKKFPGNREKSVYASVELSLRRMTPANRERARVLGVFHGGVQIGMLQVMMQWEAADVSAVAADLIQTGLATPNRYKHLGLNPALCPYLRGQMSAAELASLTARWGVAMEDYARFLKQHSNQNAELAATLTGLELPNLFVYLEQVQRVRNPEATIDLTTNLYRLLHPLGKPRLLERVAAVRDAASAALGTTWNHAQFAAQGTRIEQQLAGGQMREAFAGAQALLQRAKAAGEKAYPSADYDLAMACWLLGRVLKTAGQSQPAVALLEESQRRFEAINQATPDAAAARMASVSIKERAECLICLGRLDESALAYEEAIRRDEDRGDARAVAVGKGQLGTVRLQQKRFDEALKAYEEARERFTKLDEPGTVGAFWHQTGMTYQDAGKPEAAEDAYRKSLAIEVRLGNVAGQASTLTQLGNLYDDALKRPEEAVTFYRQAADKYVEIADVANEGRARNNLGETLRTLHRFDDARLEIHRAIKFKSEGGHASSPWKTWRILAGIETECGDHAAAQKANVKATELFLAYRRDGGENHEPAGRIALAVTDALKSGGPAAASEQLQQFVASANAVWHPYLHALQAIVAGSRDRTLAAAPEFDYMLTAELLFLIEMLEKS